MVEHTRAAALSVAVSLAAAKYHDLPVPVEFLTGDTDPAAVREAQSWLSALLIEHGAAGLPGSVLLALIGRTAAWVASGGGDAGP